MIYTFGEQYTEIAVNRLSRDSCASLRGPQGISHDEIVKKILADAGLTEIGRE